MTAAVIVLRRLRSRGGFVLSAVTTPNPFFDTTQSLAAFSRKKSVIAAANSRNV